MSEQHAFGWLKQPSDPRDFAFKPSAVLAAYPVEVDLRPEMPAVVDQGNLGACTSNAIVAIAEHAERKEGDKDAYPLSRLELYWRERKMEGTVFDDAGAYIRDGLKVLAQTGCARETTWPYEVAHFMDDPTLCMAVHKSDRYHMALSYHAIFPSESNFKACLAEGFPFVFGFDVPASFENIGADGIWNPAKNEQIIGGHATVCVGYKQNLASSAADDRWIVRNSWGASFGDKGYFYVPLAWLSANAQDCWTIRSTT